MRPGGHSSTLGPTLNYAKSPLPQVLSRAEFDEKQELYVVRTFRTERVWI